MARLMVVRTTVVKLLVLPLVALGVLGAGPGVAGACACGAVLADQRLQAVQETALVEIADGTEAVTLTVATRTDATRAAFLMPVPGRARFELADADVFAELDAVSKPRIEYRDVVTDGGGSGGAAPGGADRVTVTDHTTVGPFEVAQLTGADASAVTGWLGDNDFTLPADLADALTPYLAEGWLVVAVRLTPDTVGTTFADGLPSMRFTFGTDTPVYPMRLSATAEYAQPLRLYVLADHRMDVDGPAPRGPEAELTYANWVRPADLTDHPVLARMIAEPRFLTRYDATFPPADITDDIHLTQAATDETYRAVVVENRYVTSTATGTLVIWGVSLAGVLALVVIAVRRRHLTSANGGGRQDVTTPRDIS
jgi:hypothetical protein